MHLEYKNKKIEAYCQNMKIAQRKFNQKIAFGIIETIIYLESAHSLKDVVLRKKFHFHKLKNRENLYAIDVTTRKDGYRMLISPIFPDTFMNESDVLKFCHEIKIITIMEVTNHYE